MVLKSDMESCVCACVLSLDSSPNRQHFISRTAKPIGTYHRHDLVAYEVSAAFLPPCNEREKANFPLVSASNPPGPTDLQILGTDILIHFSKYGRSLPKRNIDPCLQEAINKAATCGIDEEPIGTGLFYFFGNVNLVLRLSRRLTCYIWLCNLFSIVRFIRDFEAVEVGFSR